MKLTNTQKIKVGIFTVAGIVLMVIAIFLVGANKNMFGGTYSINGYFRNVGGLQVGNNIRFAGINIGTVENIDIINDTTVKVEMRLQNKVKPFLKEDATASIGSDGLMGDKLVTIAPGTNSTQRLKEGAVIRTAEPIEMDKIITRISSVALNAEIITGDLAAITTNIREGKGSLGKLLYDDGLARNLEGTVETANQTMQSIKSGSEKFGENMQALRGNILFRGYFKKKDREKKEKQEQQKSKETEKDQDKETEKPKGKK